MQKIADSLKIQKVQRHIFLCCDQTKPKCCEKGRSLVAWDHLKRRLNELGLAKSGVVQRTKANCLRICAGGPVAVVYPEGAWYRECDPANLDRIIDEHLVSGKLVDELLIGVFPLRAPSPDGVNRGADETCER